DAENFGIQQEIVDRIIEEVLESWKIALDVNFTRATQCDEAIDLKFYLGVVPGSKSESPQASHAHESLGTIFSQTSEDIAGLAVRTEYDETNLRGRGFVYIAPQQGPLSFQRPEFMEIPWQVFQHKILRIAISHEVGHVFGLEHSHGDGDIMGARVIESLLMKSNLKWMAVSDSVRKAFHEKLDRYTPRNLVTLPETAKFTRCLDDKCRRFRFMVLNDTTIIFHIWSWIPADVPTRVMESSQLEEILTLNATSVGLEPLASVVADGKSTPVIHATRATYSGRMSDGQSILVDWTAGKTPRVLVLDGGNTTTMLE
ncbi:hypothetical protein EBZ80_18195, partial [bacterium]|nr:hypothetical protein [bacterium]